MTPPIRNKGAISAEVPPLITAVEALVNQTSTEHLRTAPINVNVKGYSPFHMSDSLENLDTQPLPIGILLTSSQAERFIPSLGDFVNMDARFTFPFTDPHQPDFSVTLNFNDGSESTIQYTEDGAIRTFASPDEIVHTELLDYEDADGIVNNLGLPRSLKGENFEHLLVEFNNIKSINFERKREVKIDPITIASIAHSAFYGVQTTGQKALIQELSVNLDHIPKRRVNRLAKRTPSQRTGLRFDRDEATDQSGWRYRGSYISSLQGSDISGELVPGDQTLVVPTAAVLKRVVEFLEAKPR